jgi:NAD(P)-dependent dehydrogenase (short-subunit alcohol dehydrogenase family)
MSGRLKDKVCVITGAAGGIGSASASLFASEGARVVGVDLVEHSVGEFSLRADVADEKSVADLYRWVREELGRVDVLFNNAGISPTDDASVLDTDESVWERVQAVNLRSVFLCCKHGIPHLLINDPPIRGSVINTASFVAVVGAATSQIAYTASKGGVLALSRELGVQFAQQGLRVNALCPGPVDTPLLRELYAKDPEQAARRLVHVPMGRFARAEETSRPMSTPRRSSSTAASPGRTRRPSGPQRRFSVAAVVEVDRRGPVTPAGRVVGAQPHRELVRGVGIQVIAEGRPGHE